MTLLSRPKTIAKPPTGAGEPTPVRRRWLDTVTIVLIDAAALLFIIVTLANFLRLGTR